MSDAKKKRLSMLDGLAAAGKPPEATPMMSSNRALRSARDAVDKHQVWELDPRDILDDRPADRLDPADVADLRDSIEATGQTVPILVRRDPQREGRYLLVYGRRRLEAIRSSETVTQIKALIANLDETKAVEAQITENMARRDLSYIEKALFARELIDQGFGNQTRVAEVLTVSKSAISMALAVVEGVGPALIRAIGPAPGVGRPRWEALSRALESGAQDRARLAAYAEDLHTRAMTAHAADGTPWGSAEISADVFERIAREVGDPPAAAPAPSGQAQTPARGGTRETLMIDGARAGALRTHARGVSLDLAPGPFADWVASQGQTLIDELHARYEKRAED